MNRGYLILNFFVFLLLGMRAALGQNVLIYSEDFENSNGGFTLNAANIVGNNTGTNQWVVNNAYDGQGIYPNTISQDSTTGGLINFAPFSRYLHVTDQVQASSGGPANANYNPSVASDRVAASQSFCTLGMNNVVLAFYYTCVGSSTAFGEVYYSADGGPWTLLNNSTLSNTNRWKYIELSHPDFFNRQNLRIAFRWQNQVAPPPPGAGLGIDAIRLVGVRDPIAYPVNFTINSITPNPVCQQNNVVINFSISQPLCGLGFYEFQLSNAQGQFINPTNLGIYQLNNTSTSITLGGLQIPANTPPGTCYRIRIVRGDVTPMIISDTSICIQVIACPNVITTLPPVVVSNPLDTVCVGSVIDVPFFSTGVYVNNTYVAQLSDANGLFPPNPNVLGTFPNSSTYDPALGSPPGNVSGLIQPLFHPIPPGCNYYIRVISINPAVVGSVFGPFCIRECDIETNNRQDLSFCIDNINGADTTITIEINQLGNDAVYAGNNQFQVQLLSSQTFAVVNTGGIGTVNATTDTTLTITIPNLPGLGALGLVPGMYYMRVIATNSSEPWNTLGTLIRLTIGAPNPSGLTILTYNPFAGVPPFPFPGDSTVCLNDGIFFTFAPFNPQSTYNWTLNGQQNWATDLFIGILFNGLGNNVLTVQETNFGCVGPVSPAANIKVIGPPNVNIIGPSSICEGDTATFSVPLSQSTYYSWSSPQAVLVDSLNNVANFAFPVVGTNTILISAVNKCGTRNNSRTINVRPLPLVDAGPDTLICSTQTISLSTISGNGYNYFWFADGAPAGNTQSITVSPDTTTTYVIKTTSAGSLQCTRFDTVTVFVQQPKFLPGDTIVLCEGESVQLKPDTTGIFYLWSTGQTTPEIAVSDSGWYFVLITISDEICEWVDSFYVSLIPCYIPFEIPTVFTPNGDGFNDAYTAISTFAYQEFQLDIFNRWGQLVYTTTNPFFQWNGKHYKTNASLPDGTYFFVAKVKHLEYDYDKKGTVTILGSKQ